MITFDDRQFTKDMNSFIAYAQGFMEGTQDGKSILLEKLGKNIKEILEQYIDSMARVDPRQLHHVYEWEQTGSPTGRLFNVDYMVKGGGLSINTTFTQSSSVKSGSKVPFYDKARIMENGIPVVIKPKPGGVLAFDDNGEPVFTKKQVTVMNPGGDFIDGAFEKTLRTFFTSYLSQTFLEITGLRDNLNKKKSFGDGAKAGGRSKGYADGVKWIAGGVN